MKQAATRLLSFAGLVTWGDIGPLTVYRNKKGKLVLFLKTHPEPAASEYQTVTQDRFRGAARSWQALPTAYKEAFELATHRLSLPLTGYNLFVSYVLHPDIEIFRTIQRQAAVILLPYFPPYYIKLNIALRFTCALTGKINEHCRDYFANPVKQNAHYLYRFIPLFPHGAITLNMHLFLEPKHAKWRLHIFPTHAAEHVTALQLDEWDPEGRTLISKTFYWGEPTNMRAQTRILIPARP